MYVMHEPLAPVEKHLAIAADIRDSRLRRLYEYWLAKRGQRRFPSRRDIDPAAYRVRAACLSQLGRIDEAKAALAEFLRLTPDATVISTKAQVPLKQPEDIKRYIDALKLAGLRDS